MLNSVWRLWREILLLSVLVLVLILSMSQYSSGLLQTTSVPDDHGELLAYSIYNYDGGRHVLLYNPLTGTSKRLQTNTELLGQLSYSKDGHLAFALPKGAGSEIYILNTLSSSIKHIRVSTNQNVHNIPLAWSPDGHYLAFESYYGRDNRFLYV